MSLWLRVGGVPATEIAAHSPPTWEMLADGGCGSASWSFALSTTSQHPALRVRSLVQIMYGPMPVYTGLLTEPDRTTWECSAYGLSASLSGYLALNASGNPTLNVADAVGQASARPGFGWVGTNPWQVGGTVAGDTSGGPISIGELLDRRAMELGQRWGVDGMGCLFMRSDPTVPTLMTAPGAATFSPTDENAPRRLVGRYFNGTSYPVAYAGGGVPEESRDLTDRGTLTQAQAEAIVGGELSRLGSTGWVGSTTLPREQFMTLGGNPANFVDNHAGRMLRAHGLTSNAVSSTFAQDVVIGKTTYTAGENVITIEPVNAAPRTLTDVVAAA